MKKLISSLLAVVMVLSLSTTAFAATSVSEFTDSDYLTIKPIDYHKMRTFSTNGKGVSWESGATVIYGESGLFGTIPGAKGDGIWQKRPSVDTSVKSINFPTSVVILGIQTLDGRDAVTSINFNELTNLKYIGISAFNRTKITTADLSNTKVVNIDDGAFMAGTQPTLTTFTAPSTLKRIGVDTFANQTRVTLNLNEGLEIIGDGALKDAPGTTIPSTVKEMGKNALNASKTYKVTKNSYAEQYCKDNSIKYVYTDNTSPTNPTDPTTPTTPPATNFPTMEYTKSIGPVTFSNYISSREFTGRDANNKDVSVTLVNISKDGSMRADKDSTEFLFNKFDGWNTTNEKSIGRTDNKFGNGRVQGDDVTIKTFNITPYATTKSNGTWSKGLTWQFGYDSQYNNNTFKITVEQGGQKYLYYVSVSTDKPTGSTTTPTTPTNPTPATKATANPTNSKVTVNGKQVSFDAYNINNNNYFKLRDVAQIIRGTDKQFNVTWDGSKNAINLITNTEYETTGGELTPGDGVSKQSTLSTSTIFKDGVEVSLTAYNINGNNYFKLRDLGLTFNFSVTWDGVNNTVVIDTTKPYTE